MSGTGGDRTDPVAVLGDDIFLLVLDELEPQCLLQIDQVCVRWREFVHAHDVWRRICRREGVDVHEHKHAQGERRAVARGKIDWKKVKSKDDWRAEVAKGEAYDGVLEEEEGDVHRRAYLDHMMLSNAWTNRHGYECLVRTPAHKIRSVYMDDGEDFIYALTEGTPSWREEYLLVLNKYTGKLLERIPGITPEAEIKVGAGYVAVSQYQRDSIRDRRREYSRLGRVTVFRTANAAARAGASWRGTRPLEFACSFDEQSPVAKSDVMALGMIQGNGYLVAADLYSAHLVDLDRGLSRSISLERVDTVDSPLMGERDMTDKEPKLWSANFTSDHLFLITQYQVHIFTLKGVKIAAYPDPCADMLTHAALGYKVGSLFRCNTESCTSQPVEAAPDYIPRTETQSWNVDGARPGTEEFIDAVEYGFAYPSEWDDDESIDSEDSIATEDWMKTERFRFDGMNAYLQDVSFTNRDMVIRGHMGAIFVVRDYIRVLRDAARLEWKERTAFVARHAIVVGFYIANDVLVTHGDRIALHKANSTIVMIDTTQLPSLPLPEDDPIPTIAVYTFEVSSLEEIADESSIVMDARAVYLADWDKLSPAEGRVPGYWRLFHDFYQEDDWPVPIRPCWGCVKVWTFRPAAALLRRADVRKWAEESAYVRRANIERRRVYWPPTGDWDINLDGVAYMLGFESDDEDSDEDSDEEDDSDEDDSDDEEVDWADGLDGLANLLGVDVRWRAEGDDWDMNLDGVALLLGFESEEGDEEDEGGDEEDGGGEEEEEGDDEQEVDSAAATDIAHQHAPESINESSSSNHIWANNTLANDGNGLDVETTGEGEGEEEGKVQLALGIGAAAISAPTGAGTSVLVA